MDMRFRAKHMERKHGGLYENYKLSHHLREFFGKPRIYIVILELKSSILARFFFNHVFEFWRFAAAGRAIDCRYGQWLGIAKGREKPPSTRRGWSEVMVSNDWCFWS